jgi:molybdopterin-guanine dinucleotide biosynthesis protein A
MGQNKALMPLSGRPLISHVLDKLSRLCDELVISANDRAPYARFGVRVVRDVVEGKGALGGIHAGLKAIRNERAIVVACDLPFLSLPLLRYLVVEACGYDVVVPRLGRYYEPLHAVYDVNCIAPIERLISRGPRRIVHLFTQVRVREVTEDSVRLFGADMSFYNVNTPGEWREAQRFSPIAYGR